MHRPLLIAAFALLLASVPLLAQHGGGHASGGGHGGFAGHGSFGGHIGGGHAIGGMHSGAGFTSRSFGRGSFNRPQSSRGFNHSGVGLRLRTRGFRSNCFGYGCWWGYGYPWYGGIDPYWGWDSDSSSDPGPDPNPQYYDDGLANQMNEQGVYPRRMPDRGDPDGYARSAPPPPRQEPRASAITDTVLVFRDQRKQEVQNYAIVGHTLWIFSPERTQKVPLADLDIEATQKANDARGVDFRVPSAEPGQ
jgi:hypothetical protein